MSTIDLKEFRSITRISEKALIWLLEKGALPIQISQGNKLMIDMSKVDMQRLVSALNQELTKLDSEEYNLMVEEAGKIIRDEVEELIDATISGAK